MAKYWSKERENADGAHRPHEVALSIYPLSAPMLPTSLIDPSPTQGREQFLKYGVPLYQAALQGDWETAEEILTQSPHWLNAPITKRNDRALHISAAAKQVNFVRNLVGKMSNVDLELRNTSGNTAFCFAATSGVVEIAKVMVEMNGGLANIRGSAGMTPLHMAVLLGHKEMVLYLLSVTHFEKLTKFDRVELLTSSIEADLFDVALRFLEEDKSLALARNAKQETPLHALARKCLRPIKNTNIWKKLVPQWKWSNKGTQVHAEDNTTMAIKLVKELWGEVIKEDEEKISNLIGEPWRLLFVAAEIGNVEFLTILIQSYPDIIWKVDENNHSIFHIAAMNRHEEIFNMIHEVGAIKDLIASYIEPNTENNMLHLAAQRAPQHRLNCVSGAALQMQRELLWFQAVKDVVQPQYAVAKNHKGETPQSLFTKAHEELRKQGEEWMKTTSESCTLVAALITTVAFTAVFTIPGGINSNTGSPILLTQAPFIVFSISNALSLFSSSASILMFLSILTSRYSERDFLRSLPLKLVIGFMSLFVSIASMMVAFVATFSITFREGERRVSGPVIMLAFVPVVVYAWQEYPLLVDILRSTYKSQSLFEFSGKGRIFLRRVKCKKI